MSESIAVRCCCLKGNYSQGKLQLGGYLHGFNESNEVLFVPGFPLPLGQAQTLSLLRSAFNLILKKLDETEQRHCSVCLTSSPEIIPQMALLVSMPPGTAAVASSGTRYLVPVLPSEAAPRCHRWVPLLLDHGGELETLVPRGLVAVLVGVGRVGWG